MVPEIQESSDYATPGAKIIISLFIAFVIAIIVAGAGALGRPNDAATEAAAAKTGQTAPSAGPPAEPSGGNAANGQTIFTSSGCGACHAVPNVAQGVVGPSLATIGVVAATRRPGYSAGQYLVESITHPSAFVVQGYQDGLMPKTYSQTLKPGEINDLAAYLLTLR
ncbi:MAG: cytochrome c [Anaerolineae bacterium]